MVNGWIVLTSLVWKYIKAVCWVASKRHAVLKRLSVLVTTLTSVVDRRQSAHLATLSPYFSLSFVFSLPFFHFSFSPFSSSLSLALFFSFLCLFSLFSVFLSLLPSSLTLFYFKFHLFSPSLFFLSSPIYLSSRFRSIYFLYFSLICLRTTAGWNWPFTLVTGSFNY